MTNAEKKQSLPDKNGPEIFLAIIRVHPLIFGILLITFFALLSGCASQPRNVEDACEIFDEKGGLFNNWYRYSKKTEKQFGVPVPVLMATIYQESRFQARVKPPRKKLLGFIPWLRPSSAYGYPQAKDDTWTWYRKKSGNGIAERDEFKDAVHFVGWYHFQSYKRNGIPRNDAYNLYLAYHEGHGGYKRQTWSKKPWLKKIAANVAAKARQYEAQLALCGRN